MAARAYSAAAALFARVVFAILRIGGGAARGHNGEADGSASDAIEAAVALSAGAPSTHPSAPSEAEAAHAGGDPHSASASGGRAKAEARLLRAVRDEAGVTAVRSAKELLSALWRRARLLWDGRQARGEGEVWESLVEVVEAIEAWGLGTDVIGTGAAAASAQAMLAETRARSEIEYGAQSADAQKLCALEHRIGQLVGGA